jgi:hypothetical protein
VPRKEKPNVKLRFAHSKRRFNRRRPVKLRFAHSKRRFNRRQRNALNKKRRG